MHPETNLTDPFTSISGSIFSKVTEYISCPEPITRIISASVGGVHSYAEKPPEATSARSNSSNQNPLSRILSSFSLTLSSKTSFILSQKSLKVFIPKISITCLPLSHLSFINVKTSKSGYPPIPVGSYWHIHSVNTYAIFAPNKSTAPVTPFPQYASWFQPSG